MFAKRSSTLDEILHRPRPTKWQQFCARPCGFLANYLWKHRPSSSPKPSLAAAVATDASSPPLTVVAIADTHLCEPPPTVPDGDVLIHAGDFTQSGSFDETQQALTWINSLPHPHKVVIAGNHETWLDPEFSTLPPPSPASAAQSVPSSAHGAARDPAPSTRSHESGRRELDWGDIIYLQNSGTTLDVSSSDLTTPTASTPTTSNSVASISSLASSIASAPTPAATSSTPKLLPAHHGTSLPPRLSDAVRPRARKLKLWGSPLTPRHGTWAFQYARILDVWHGALPEGLDVLITHGPPLGHLDGTHATTTSSTRNREAGGLANSGLATAGCTSLLDELWRLQRKPRVHVFGHVHEGRGVDVLEWDGVQRAYEGVVRRGGGFGRLLWLVGQWLKAWVKVKVRRKNECQRTVVVNAAVVGGLRDQLRRDGIVVCI